MKYGDLVPAAWGYATVLADFDFETVSHAGYVYDFATRKWGSLPGFSSQKRGLGAVGTCVYVEHYSFRPLMLAYNLKDGRGKFQWEHGEPFTVLEPLFDHIRTRKLLEAHNCGFEWNVWQRYCVPVFGWPSLDRAQLRCSAAKSRANGLPGKLEEVGKVLKIEHQKDADGARLMKMFSMPCNPKKADPRTHVYPADAPDEWRKYKAYNMTDIDAESEVSIRSPDLSPFELDTWLLGERINDRGMAVNREAIADCIAIVEQAYATYGAECRRITGGIEPSELQQLRGWLSARGVSMMGMTEKDVEGAMDRLKAHAAANGGDLGLFREPYRVLELRQMLSSASVKKLYALQAQTARDGRVHDMYQYWSTHHGRTGGYGPQPSNLYKGEWHTPEEVAAAFKVLATRSLAAVEAAYPNISPLDVVNNCLRSLFVAAPGCTLISSDYSAIEDVVLAALAGEQWVLDVHRTHGMVYEAQISRMTGVPFEDFVKHRIDTGGIATYGEHGQLISIKGGKHHPLRQQGKLAKLSGGYASWIAGWKKFGADKYYDNDYAIKQAILSYRDTVPATVEFWGGQTRDKFKHSCRQELYGLEGAAISAVQNPGFSYRVGMIAFEVRSDVLYMQLPSGRLITYHEPRLRPSTRNYAEPWELELSYMGWNSNPDKGAPGWIQQDLYGGVLTQNATGGTARDVMMHGMLNLDRAGYPIVMQTYDEAVAEVPIIECLFPEGTHSRSVAKFEACMNDLPGYARDWPIFARGGWMGTMYGKWG